MSRIPIAYMSILFLAHQFWIPVILPTCYHSISLTRTSRGKDQLEDLMVLKRSPDLLNNVKIGQGQLRLIIETYLVLPFMGVAAILIK